MGDGSSPALFLLQAWGLIALICGAVSAILAHGARRSTAGWFVLGALFGPVGVAGAGVLSWRYRRRWGAQAS